VTEVFAGEERTAGRGADGRASVVVGETHALSREPVEVWCFDFLLPVTTKFAVAEIISEDENDIGWPG